MRRLARVAILASLLGTSSIGCQHQADPIYSPPPGGHSALSKPPANLLQTGQ